MDLNGNSGKVAWALVFFLLGTVMTGASMVIRGDFLGNAEAREVEMRINDRLDYDNDQMKEDIREIRRMVTDLYKLHE